MTLGQLMYNASARSVDEREDYLIMFTVGENGYVCKNEGSTDRSKALYISTYRKCQVWIENRGIAAALAYIEEHSGQVPELTGKTLTLAHMLSLLSAT